MDSIISESYDGQSVNWAHPVSNSAHLPPKNPHSFSSYSKPDFFENSRGLNLSSSQSIRGGGHRIRSFTGYLPQRRGTWPSDKLGSSDVAVILEDFTHRRSSSDSITFLDISCQFMDYLENITEEDEFVHQEPPLLTRVPAHQRCLSAKYNSLQCTLPGEPGPHSEMDATWVHSVRRLDKDLIGCNRDDEPFQKHQYGHENLATYERLALKLWKFESLEASQNSGHALKNASPTNSSLKSNHRLASTGQNYIWSTSSCGKCSTITESNSLGDDSYVSKYIKSSERFRNASEARNGDGGECSVRLHYSCTGSHQMDPKNAKRSIASRQSAQRSRVRKLEYISELERNVDMLQTEIASLSPKVEYYDHERVQLNAENILLKQKLAAISNTQQITEAHNKALKTEFQRLCQIFNKQQQPQLNAQHSHQRPLFVDTFDLELLKLSKLDLGTPILKPRR